MSRFALGLLFTLLASPAAAQGKAEVTSFAGKTLDGKRISLADQRGKAVVISFWATWCVPCKRELDDLAKIYKKQKGEGLEVLALANAGGRLVPPASFWALGEEEIQCETRFDPDLIPRHSQTADLLKENDFQHGFGFS